MKNVIKCIIWYFISLTSIAQNNNSLSINIDSANLDCFKQLIIYTNDTIVKERCIERNAKIFVENKSYIYLGTILNSKLDTISSTKIYFQGTNKRFHYSPQNQMSLNIDFERFENDSVKLNSVFENSNCCNWVNTMESGVVENIEKCWIKAIRNNQFRYTETAGFPDVQYPLEIHKEWSREVKIGNYGWGTWCNKTSRSNYKVISKNIYQLKNEKIECWKIESLSDFEGKQNKHTYLFNEDFGFVLMQYEFHDGIKINFEMIDFKLK